MKKLLLILIVLAATITSCNYVMGKRIKGNGIIKTAEHSVTAFKNIEVSGAIDLYVAQGETKPVKIEADENLLQYIEVQQKGSRIVIKSRDGVNLQPTGKIKVFISTPVYNHIDVSGASNIIGQTKIMNTEELKLEVSGAGEINMDVNAPTLSAEVSGAGSVNLKGETKTFDLTLTGAAKAHCYELLSENTRVDISGAGEADVFASVKLAADVSGAGNVTYKGGATNVSQQVSGAGSVKKVD
ncbi:MAG: head GIN domain-containing protein [Chitinophagaceae bacterium]